MHQRLVGIDHLFQVERLVGVVCEGCRAVELAVHLHVSLFGNIGLHLYHRGGEDAAGKRTAVGHEVDGGGEVGLQLSERLPDFRHMLVLEGLVDAQVVGPPGEVGGGTRLLSGTRRARDGMHQHIVMDEAVGGCGQQPQLDGGGETAGVGHKVGRADGVAVQFGQAVDGKSTPVKSTPVKPTPDPSLGRGVQSCLPVA